MICGLHILFYIVLNKMKYEADYLLEPYSSTYEHVTSLNFSNPSFSVNFSYRLKPTSDNFYCVFTERMYMKAQHIFT
jgi:hypothetical protein